MKTALAALALSTLLFPLQSSKRKVLLFSTSSNPLLLRQQKILAAGSAGLAERDISVETYLSGPSGNAFFQKYKVPGAPFTFLLIGKDGGEKLRSASVVTTATLFGLIDAMPMRRSEMHRKQ